MKVFKIIEIPLSIFFIVLAVLLYKSTGSFPESSQATTAIYIKVLAIALFILGVLQFIFTITAKNESLKKLFEDPKRFFTLIVLLIIYVVSIGRIGFNVSTVVFLIISIFFMGYKNHVKNIIISICITVFVYVLFHEMFKISLPEGLFF